MKCWSAKSTSDLLRKQWFSQRGLGAAEGDMLQERWWVGGRGGMGIFSKFCNVHEGKADESVWIYTWEV